MSKPALDVSSVTLPAAPLVFCFDAQTALGLVESLGGVTSVAYYLDTSPSQVESWTVSGAIPPGWHLRLFAKALAEGLTVNPIIFGFNDRDVEAQALARLMIGGAND